METVMIILIVIGFIIAYILLSLGIILLAWKMQLNKEVKRVTFNTTSNLSNIFTIQIKEVTKIALGVKIVGVLTGNRPKFSNVIYFDEGQKHIPVFVYYSKQDGNQITLSLYGYKEMNTNGILTNERKKYQIKTMKQVFENIEYPLVIKPRLVSLLFIFYSTLIGCIFLAYGFKNIYNSRLIYGSVFLVISAFFLWVSYLSLKLYINQRGKITTNGHLYVGKNRYRSKEINYKVTTTNGQTMLTILDSKQNQILAIDQHYHCFDDLYAYLVETRKQKKKEELYTYLLETEFYLPLTVDGIVGINTDNGFMYVVFDDYNQMQSIEYDKVAGEEILRLPELVDLTMNFTKSVAILFELSHKQTSFTLTKEIWEEIKELYLSQ